MLHALPSGRVIIRPDCPGDLTQAPEPSKRQITAAWDKLIRSLSQKQMEDLEASLSIIRKTLRVD